MIRIVKYNVQSYLHCLNPVYDTRCLTYVTIRNMLIAVHLSASLMSIHADTLIHYFYIYFFSFRQESLTGNVNLSMTLSSLSGLWHHSSLLDHQFSLELHAARIGLSASTVLFPFVPLLIVIKKMCSNVLSIVFTLFFITALAISEDLYEGSSCKLENGNLGLCKKLLDCPSRLQEVKDGERQSTSTGRCGFVDFIEIVCCPVSASEKISLRPADAACQEYDTKIAVEEAKVVVFHVFSGIEAQIGEFPYMVALGYRDEDGSSNTSIKYNCGGSLISPQHVLTAAHCVNNINKNVPIEVRLGNENLLSTNKEVQRIPISDIISHPKYKRSTHYNDVAILKLKTEVEFSNMVKPICLETKSVNDINVIPEISLRVIGWGATSFEVMNSTHLMKTPNLSIVSKEKCAELYQGFPKLPRGIDDNMICAIDTNSSRRADACYGDSGGPLLMKSEKGDSIIGITSFGQTCGTSVPGVYTAVYSYLDWIENHVWISNRTESAVKTKFINFTYY